MEVQEECEGPEEAFVLQRLTDCVPRNFIALPYDTCHVTTGDLLLKIARPSSEVPAWYHNFDGTAKPAEPEAVHLVEHACQGSLQHTLVTTMPTRK